MEDQDAVIADAKIALLNAAYQRALKISHVNAPEKQRRRLLASHERFMQATDRVEQHLRQLEIARASRDALRASPGRHFPECQQALRAIILMERSLRAMWELMELGREVDKFKDELTVLAARNN